MWGAIIGDIAGSRFEFNNIKTKNFELFGTGCRFTDDTVLTIAVADALMNFDEITDEVAFKKALILNFHQYGRDYLCCGFGSGFSVGL